VADELALHRICDQAWCLVGEEVSGDPDDLWLVGANGCVSVEVGDGVGERVDMVEGVWRRARGEDTAAAGGEVQCDGATDASTASCYDSDLVLQVLVAETEGCWASGGGGGGHLRDTSSNFRI
jgi:hypothetical protein